MFNNKGCIRSMLNRIKKNRVTALVGAGACIDIGGPTTVGLTDSIRGLSVFDSDGQNVNFIDQVAQQLNNYYRSSQCNFEDIFHTIEDLDSYAGGFRQSTVKEYKPVIGAFVNQLPGEWFNSDILIQSASIIIEEIARQISIYDNNINNNQNDWFSKFWAKATNQCSFDIATLNYDTCIEKSIGAFEDGYESIGKGFDRFNLHKFLHTHNSRIFHPHGCIVYGYLPNSEDPNQYIFDYGFHDLYKFDSYRTAQQTWFGMSNRNTQSHEQIIVGPIITGLRKTDKILTNPYSAYYYMLQKAIIENDRLLVIGYSFGDKHFNDLLERFTSLHSKNRRIVIITYCNPDDWCVDPTIMDWMNNDMRAFIYKAFRERDPFRGHYDFSNPFVSQDGRVKIYLTGFMDTVNKYCDDIIDFLTS